MLGSEHCEPAKPLGFGGDELFRLLPNGKRQAAFNSLSRLRTLFADAIALGILDDKSRVNELTEAV